MNRRQIGLCDLWHKKSEPSQAGPWARSLLRWIKGFVATLALLSTVACSTLVNIQSSPSGAHVYLNGKYVGRTPLNVELEDGLAEAAGTSAKFEIQGYQTQYAILKKHWSVGFLILDGLLCVPTLGLGCYLIYFNGKSHDNHYFQLLRPQEEQKTQAPVRVEEDGDVIDIVH